VKPGDIVTLIGIPASQTLQLELETGASF